VFQSEAQKLWLQRMGERGWTVPTWPKEYGGGGLDPAQAKVLREEMARLNAGRRCRASASGCWARHS
jgi:acyl-CoA dehydrogenase